MGLSGVEVDFTDDRKDEKHRWEFILKAQSAKGKPEGLAPQKGLLNDLKKQISVLETIPCSDDDAEIAAAALAKLLKISDPPTRPPWPANATPAEQRGALDALRKWQSAVRVKLYQPAKKRYDELRREIQEHLRKETADRRADSAELRKTLQPVRYLSGVLYHRVENRIRVNAVRIAETLEETAAKP